MANIRHKNTTRLVEDIIFHRVIMHGWLQFGDGFLTYLGICHFGIAAEGNPLLHYLFTVYDPFTVLVYAKTLGFVIYALIGLVLMRIQLAWLIAGLFWMNFIMFIVAIVPWSILLLMTI